MASAAQAYLKPGHGNPNAPHNEPNPPRYCEDSRGNPYPCEQGPSYPSYPSNPPSYPPSYPGTPHEPYPGNPGYPPPPPNYPPSYPPSYPGNPGYPAPPPSYPGNPSYGDREVKSIYMNRSVRNERISLRQLAGIDSRYRGWEVASVRANTRPNSPGTTIAQLLMDGRIVAQQRNPGYQLYLTPSTRVVIGGSASSLQLAISGSTFIDSIEIELVNSQGGWQPDPNPGYPGYSERVDLNIYRHTMANDRIDITPMIDMYRYRGMRIESIEIQGRADYNVSIVEALINGFSQGTAQFDSGFNRSQTIYLNQRPVIGNGADSVVLYTRGNMTVQKVVLNLTR